ncbi:hypothetical protein EAF00_000026 [Botryotinia globosa]|nr:hypothetical protein EAF00_000026 [Botryotinia globosa]
MSSRTIVLVTGANSGIGYEAVKAFLQSTNHTIYFSALKEVPDSKNTIETLEMDLVSDESIEKAFETVMEKHGRVDSLVNHAGATFDIAYTSGKRTLRECFTNAYDVNVAGTHVLTSTFTPPPPLPILRFAFTIRHGFISHQPSCAEIFLHAATASWMA